LPLGDDVQDILSRSTDAKSLVFARLARLEGSLDGFPAAGLLNDWLMVDERSGAVDCRTRQLAAYILGEWTTIIERNLERFPTATVDALEDIRKRMIDTRNALLHLRLLLQEPGYFADLCEEPCGCLGPRQLAQVARPSPADHELIVRSALPHGLALRPPGPLECAFRLAGTSARQKCMQ
jgi:hypothetical protein